MEIKTTGEAAAQGEKALQPRPEMQHALAQLARDPAHNIAWTPEVNHLMSIAPTGTHSLPTGMTFNTATLPVGAGGGIKPLKDEKSSSPVSDMIHEVGQAHVPLGPFEVIVTSNEAYLKWFKSEKINKAEAALLTAKAITELADAVKDSLPSPLPSFVKIIKVGVGLGNKVWAYLHEHSETIGKSK